MSERFYQRRGDSGSANDHLSANRREERGRLTHLLLQQRGEVLPETLLEVVAPRLSLLLLWTHRQRRRRRENV